MIIKLHLLKPTSINYAKLNLFLVLFLTFINLSNSQTVKGFVIAENDKPINAKLLIKKESSPDIISEFCLINNGVYSYKLKKVYNENILLEVVSSGYISVTKKINSQNIEKEIELDFSLKKEKITTLDEIFIVSKKILFKRKKDTIIFNVNAYKDGTERKIEDLLKKLPGIEINESNGLIKYNGRLIETVNLEGDNLFGYNYTLGTKNINVDIVEEIEAIDNYSENPLLKGLEKDGKVALNLILKKNKTDLSGNVDVGGGVFDTEEKVSSNSSLNVLAINKKHKSFGTQSFNNVGLNFSPFNYSTFDDNLERLKESDYYTEKIISESNTLNILGKNRSNINNQIFTSYSSIFNFGEKLKAKVNLYYINDKINNIQYSENRYKINNESFNTSDNNVVDKKPTQYRGDIELKHNISKNSLLKYVASFRNENILTTNSLISNQQNHFKSELSSKNIFLKQQLEFTKKISTKKAFQIKAHFSSNSLTQKYNINPSVLNFNDSTTDFQNINSKKNFFELKAILLGSRINDKYNFTIGSYLNENPFQSILYNDEVDSDLAENNINNSDFITKSIYTRGSYHWKIGRLTVSPNYSFSLLFQELKNNTLNDSKLFVFEPSLDINYKINSVSFLFASVGLNKKPNPSKYLFNNNILVSNRTIIKNTPSLNLQKNENYSLSYNKYDLYNQTEIEIGASYLKENGSFFSNSIITANTSTINYFYLPEKTENIDLNFSISKFIPLLETNFKLKSFYSIFNYKNIINNSQLRSNKSSSISHFLFLKTAFNQKVNFENEINLNYNESKSDFSFKTKSFQNKFKFIFKPSKQVFATFSMDYFVPDLKNKSDDYLFIDTKVLYKPENKNWQLSLSGSNLANISFYQSIQNSDISTNVFKSNLLKRNFMINFYYSF